MSKTSVEHPAPDFRGPDFRGRDFWTTRPRRRAGERKIAGVAAAIGRRYALDPVLVRVAFVVAALFSGAGVLLYLLGWLLLPVETPQAATSQDGAAGRAARGRRVLSAALTIVLVLLLILTAREVFEGRASGVLALAVAVGTLMLLHRSRAALGERPHESPQGAWDPSGVAPFAGDLPEPATAPAPAPAPRGARSKVTPIILGLALLTGGIAVAFAPGLTAAQIAALLLGVVGLGLVAGSLLQGGRGLIFLAIPLALLTWVLPATPTSGVKLDGSYWEPVTAAQVQPHYSVTLGNGHLDLTGLRLTDGQTVTTSVAVGVGETHVILPPNVDVQVSCQTLIGQVHCLGRTNSGHPSRVAVTDNGADGPGGGKLILDVHSGVGQVHVERGS